MTRHLHRQPADRVTWDIAEAVSAQDRAYFENHPEATCYVRKAVACEFGPPAAIYHGAYVIVTQLQPGVRHRRLMHVEVPAHV